MAEGYQERNKDFLRQLELLACWIINGSGWVKKAVKPGDLLKFKEKPDMKGEEIKEFAQEAYAFAKSKFWTKIQDKYAKNTE